MAWTFFSLPSTPNSRRWVCECLNGKTRGCGCTTTDFFPFSLDVCVGRRLSEGCTRAPLIQITAPFFSSCCLTRERLQQHTKPNRIDSQISAEHFFFRFSRQHKILCFVFIAHPYDKLSTEQYTLITLISSSDCVHINLMFSLSLPLGLVMRRA